MEEKHVPDFAPGDRGLKALVAVDQTDLRTVVQGVPLSVDDWRLPISQKSFKCIQLEGDQVEK